MTKSKKVKELQWAYLTLLICFALLVAIGMASVFSTTFAADTIKGNPYSHLMRQGGLFLAGMVPAYMVYRRNLEFWRPYIGVGVLVTGLLLAAVLLVGIDINGARRWLGYGGVTFQPSEIAKIIGILYAASCISRDVDKQRHIEFFHHWYPKSKRTSWWRRHVKIPHRSLWMPGLLMLLVFAQPDGGTGIVIMAMPVVMLLVSGAHIAKVKKWIFAGIACIVLYFVYAPYRMNRIIAWLNPWDYAKTLGYQTVQSLTAIGSGGIMGQGVGQGTFKFNYLPEAHTDFAFAILSQEWGLRGSLFVIAIFCAIIYFGLFTAWHCRYTFGMFTALGISLYFGGQGFINMGMVSGVLPVVGVPLPFVSYGGTSLIVNMIAAAILLNLAKANYKEELRHPEQLRTKLQKPAAEGSRGQFPLA